MLVVLVSRPMILFTGAAFDKPPVNPVPVGADHVYNVPAGMIPSAPCVGVTVKATPLQVVVVSALIVALGSTVTITVNVVPVQFPEVGVTTYVAVIVAFVVLTSVPVTVLIPVACSRPPVKPLPVGADHVYNVPAGTIPFVVLTGVTPKV